MFMQIHILEKKWKLNADFFNLLNTVHSVYRFILKLFFYKFINTRHLITNVTKLLSYDSFSSYSSKRFENNQRFKI